MPKVTQFLLKKVFHHEKFAHFMPNEVQIDLICTWFPELSNSANNLKKGWISEFKNKELSKDQYRKLLKAKRKSPEDSKTKLLHLSWKKVETAEKIFNDTYKEAFPKVPYSFLRKVFSLKGVVIIEVSMNKINTSQYSTSVLFYYFTKAFQAEFIEDFSKPEPSNKIYLWVTTTEKLDFTGEDIKLCIEKYVSNRKFDRLKSKSLKINSVDKLEIQKKWKPRYTRIEKIYIGKSHKKIQPPIVLINKKLKPIAVMVSGDNCELCLQLSKYYAEELQINYAFSTDLKKYLFYDFTKNKLKEDSFENLPIYLWIQNWDKALKEKELKRKNYVPLDQMPIEDILKKLEAKNKARAVTGHPPLTLKEYLEKKGF